MNHTTTHQPQWQQLTDRVKKNTLPHALLLVGDNGIGKNQFANAFASAVLCNTFHKTGEICGTCQACHLAKVNTHPDLMRITSEPGHAIKVDQVRELNHFVNQTALLNGYRVIIISPATAMNKNAANALLKILEEPAGKTVLILISDLTLRLPATILSRCQKIVFRSPLNEQEKENNVFRQEFYNGLCDLIEGQRDPIELAEEWKEQDSQEIIRLLFLLVRDLLRLKTIEHLPVVNDILIKINQKWSLKQLLEYSDHVQKIYSYCREGVNLNTRLLVEELLILVCVKSEEVKSPP